MFQIFFIQSAAKEINNKATKATKRSLAYDCDHNLLQLPSPTDTFTPGESYCFPAKSFFIVGSNDVTISRISEGDVESEPVSNALGATSPWNSETNQLSETKYKIVIPQDAGDLRIISHDFKIGKKTIEEKPNFME